MSYESFESRKELILKLAEYVDACVADKRYNVFVYGSFFTEAFKPGSSDIDIAFYSESIDTAMDVEIAIREYLKDKPIAVDLVFINTNYKNSFFYAFPLTNGIQFTDYYPEHLRAFRNEIIIRHIKNYPYYKYFVNGIGFE